MKNLVNSLRIVFVVIALAWPLSATALHLILYFDINKTLIASDKAGNKSIEDVINELLSEKYTAYWDAEQNEPMTFDAYVRAYLVPDAEGEQDPRSIRLSYTQHFVDYLKSLSHPLYSKVSHDYKEIMAALESSNGIVFPSFYYLLRDLDEKEISYSIVLRSFGEEVIDVKDEINAQQGQMFAVTGNFLRGELVLDRGGNFAASADIYRQFLNNHAAIRDDWTYWMDHNGASQQGKPFYIDREDRETLSIFFDDNISTQSRNKNIIAPLDIATGVLIPIEELIESGQAVKVDTLEAIENKDYFKNKVEAALQFRMGTTPSP